jgi:hypothetical protein
MKAWGIDPKTQIPFNFIFEGPPGELKESGKSQNQSNAFYRDGKDYYSSEDGRGILWNGFAGYEGLF